MQEEGAVDVVPYPAPKPFWKQLQERLEGESSVSSRLAVSAACLADSLGLTLAADMTAAGHATVALQPDLRTLAAAMQLSALHPETAALLSAAAQQYAMTTQTGGVQMLCPPVVVH